MENNAIGTKHSLRVIIILMICGILFCAWRFCVYVLRHDNKQFLTTVESFSSGKNVMDVAGQLGLYQVSDYELTPDNIEYVKQTGLRTLPILPNSLDLRVVVYAWGRPIPPCRFIFVFYEQSNSNIVATAWATP